MLEDDHVTDMLGIVRRETGIDFLLYRRPTVLRRIQNRMVSLRIGSTGDYLARLRSDPTEPAGLAERITIKVSRFYRNAAAFDLLRRDVLPGLARRRTGQPLRIWSAGCGCGEEAYTLAMLLEDLGLEGTVDGTDVDVSALAAAQAATYGASALVELPEGWAARFTDVSTAASAAAHTVRESVRSRVRFFRHDLTSGRRPHADTPYDLVACRNVLIYFQPGAQQDAFATLVGSLRQGGALCLGEAEWPPAAVAAMLHPLSQRHRIFRLGTPGKEPEP